MINIILDTDIGCDCDDAGALALLHQLENRGECKILAVTSSTSRLDGAACIDAINKYYKKNIPVGMNLQPDFLNENPYGVYSKHISDYYPNDYKINKAKDAVLVLREALSKVSDKSTNLVIIGPLNNLANLLISKADEFINKTGVGLIKEKINKVVIMGGHFPKEGEVFYLGDKIMNAEWNILQDIKSAQKVVKLCPVEIIFCPFEVGLIKTGNRLFETNKTTPVRDSYKIHSNGPRESWDPVTCYYAVRDLDDLWEISDYGNVVILDNGVTEFINNPSGKHRYLLNKKSTEEALKKIDNLIY